MAIVCSFYATLECELLLTVRLIIPSYNTKFEMNQSINTYMTVSAAVVLS